MDFARHTFRLSLTNKDGKTGREVLEALAEKWGRPPAELIGPPLPCAAEHVWSWFCDLSCGRTAGMALNPITWEALSAWAAFRGVTLQQWEIDALRALDSAFLESRAQQPEK